MELRDKDLLSVQESRDLIERAKEAQKIFGSFSQQQIDAVTAAIAKAGSAHAEELGKMAHEETGFGKWQDKTLKNKFASENVYEAIKNMKTIGIVSEDEQNKIVNIAVPVGVIAALVPSTNPTSTVIYKALICVKAGNAVIFSPHPTAIKSISEAVRVVREAAEAAGAPAGLISCATLPTMEGTNALITSKDTNLILATGGPAMVHAAYSSGNPALGVGPGNAPAFIERSADIKMAVRRIIASKTFDNSTICASEQSVVTESCIKDRVMEEFKAQGGYFLTPEESEKVGRILMNAKGNMNAKIVGKPADFVARFAGITIPDGTKVLLSEQTQVGWNYPFSREKLTTVLGFYVEENWERACERCIELLENEGAGHTMSLHSADEKVIREFGLKKPVSRVLVNTSSSLGGVGGLTGLFPALTLGCGAVGGSATSDNVGPMNLLNIRRIAWGVREVSDLKNAARIDEGAATAKASGAGARRDNAHCRANECVQEAGVTGDALDKLVEAVLERIEKKL